MNGRDGMLVLAVTVTYHPTSDVVEHVGLLDGQVDHLLVVDNTPGQQCPEPVESLSDVPWITVVRLFDNQGIATALNLGLNYAAEHGYRWLLTLDQDSRVDASHVDTLLAALGQFRQPERVGQISPLSQLQDGSILKHKMISPSEDDVYEVVDAMTSGSLVNTEIACRIGGFKDELFIDYVDIEFSFRLRKHGYANIQVDKAVIQHSLGHSGRKRRFLWRYVYVPNYPPLRVFFQTRNRIFLAKKYFLVDPLFVLEDLLRFFFFPVKLFVFEEDRLPKFAAYLRGIIAGILFSGKSRA